MSATCCSCRPAHRYFGRAGTRLRLLLCLALQLEMRITHGWAVVKHALTANWD
jgi:hypothetical protein